MNLIERLGEKESLAAFVVNGFGGYEKAKAVLNSPNSAFLHNTKALKERLLEYRRENNIFEVGDKVVCESFKGLIKVIDILEDRLVVDTGIKTAPNSKSTMAMALPSSMFRHATEKEIEQGFRDE